MWPAGSFSRRLHRRVRSSALAALDGAGWVLARAVPPDRLHDAAWRFIQAARPLAAVLYAAAVPVDRRRDWRPLALQRMLAAAARHRPDFVLHLRLEGAEAVDELHQAHGRLILCTAHFGLTLAVNRALQERGYRTAVIAQVRDDLRGWAWGTRGGTLVLHPTPEVLARARKLVGGGTIVTVYADYVIDRHPHTVGISPNLFGWARRMGAPLLFVGSRVAADGTIVLEIRRPNRALLGTAEDAAACAEEFRDFVAERTGWRCLVSRPRPGPRAERASAVA